MIKKVILQGSHDEYQIPSIDDDAFHLDLESMLPRFINYVRGWQRYRDVKCDDDSITFFFDHDSIAMATSLYWETLIEEHCSNLKKKTET